MITNKLLFGALKEAIADRHPTDLAVLLENIQEIYVEIAKLEHDSQGIDLLNIELAEISTLIRSELSKSLDIEHNKYVSYVDDLEIDRLFERVQRP